MGPFFYSKKDIPAKSVLFKRTSFLTFFLEIPPRATTFLLEYFINILNLLIPKKLFFFLNKEDKKILLTL